ncbi:hypothetical protein R3P38DRAFT_2812269 [Favolaschia claudopus]|uniref:Uncharacterized protein n=1 Tax=Favolaschia claudopus TaxID=2862362 RepID=A0AAV9Z7M7_9AGAR
MSRPRKSASKGKKHPLLGDSNARSAKAWARPKMRELRGSSTNNPWVLDAGGNLVLQASITDTGGSAFPALQGGAAISAALHAAGAKNLSHLLPPRVSGKADLQNAPPHDHPAQLTAGERTARQGVVRADWWGQLKSSARTRPVVRSAAERARRKGAAEA